MLRSFFGDSIDYVQTRTKRVELMDYLQAQKIPAAIASSSPLARIRSHLSFHGLDTRFAALCSGYDVP